MPAAAARSRPVLLPQYCKGCGRCIEACARHCFGPGNEIDPATGLVPAILSLEACSACALCFDACPEPYALRPEGADEIPRPNGNSEAARRKPALEPHDKSRPDISFDLPETHPLLLKGTHASAIGALLAGCRHFFGYPITPSTEGAELMARLLPKLDGVFLQAVSELAAVNMMYGCGGAGLPAMTFTSSPGFSLMLEGISYMIGAEVPGVFVNVMRGGPGLGNIAPEQSDIKLACRGLGHGNTRAIVLAPSTPQEMLDLTREAFVLSFRHRNPVVVLCDGYLGQMSGRVRLHRTANRPGLPAWAVWGDSTHRRNLISSIHLDERDLEEHNRHLGRKYSLIEEIEARADLYRCNDAEALIVACNTPARMATGAVETLRGRGVKAGLFRPVTLWPFPIELLEPLLGRARRLVVVEASGGQLEDELRLALSHASTWCGPQRIEHVRRQGGALPSASEIVEHVEHWRADDAPREGSA